MKEYTKPNILDKICEKKKKHRDKTRKTCPLKYIEGTQVLCKTVYGFIKKK